MQVVCITLCKTWTARSSCPFFLTLALPPPLFFLLLKNLLRLKINILSSIYSEINFSAEPVMKINNLSRPKVSGPPQNQMVVPLCWPNASGAATVSPDGKQVGKNFITNLIIIIKVCYLLYIL